MKTKSKHHGYSTLNDYCATSYEPEVWIYWLWPQITSDTAGICYYQYHLISAWHAFNVPFWSKGKKVCFSDNWFKRLKSLCQGSSSVFSTYAISPTDYNKEKKGTKTITGEMYLVQGSTRQCLLTQCKCGGRNAAELCLISGLAVASLDNSICMSRTPGLNECLPFFLISSRSPWLSKFHSLHNRVPIYDINSTLSWLVFLLSPPTYAILHRVQSAFFQTTNSYHLIKSYILALF